MDAREAQLLLMVTVAAFWLCCGRVCGLGRCCLLDRDCAGSSLQPHLGEAEWSLPKPRPHTRAAFKTLGNIIDQRQVIEIQMKTFSSLPYLRSAIPDEVVWG